MNGKTRMKLLLRFGPFSNPPLSAVDMEAFECIETYEQTLIFSVLIVIGK